MTIQRVVARLSEVVAKADEDTNDKLYRTISKAAIKGSRAALKDVGIKTQVVDRTTVRCLLDNNYVDLNFGKLSASSGYGVNVKFKTVVVP